jgi:hypothetical protein
MYKNAKPGEKVYRVRDVFFDDPKITGARPNPPLPNSHGDHEHVEGYIETKQ